MKKTLQTLLVLSLAHHMNGMKRMQENDVLGPQKKVLIEIPAAIDQQTLISKIEEQIYTDNDPSNLATILFQPETSLLGNSHKEALYKQAESFEKLLQTPSDDPYHKQVTIKKNYLYAFKTFPQFIFPQIFFSPTPYQRLSDTRPYLKEILSALIKNEQEKIYVCSYHLRLISIGEELVEQKKRGIDVDIIINQFKVDRPNEWLIPSELQNQGISVRSPQNDPYEQMHHKFFIFKKNLFNKSILMTGSYNPTRHSDTHSWDDIIILDDQDIIDKYIERFEEIKKRSK